MATSEATSDTATAPPPPEGGTEMMSPNAMAQAVLDQAVLERDRHTATNNQSMETHVGVEQSNNNKRPRDDNDHDGKDIKEKLKQVWEGSEKDEAVVATLTLVHGELESIIQSGLEAYHGWESSKRDLSQAKEEGEAKDRELRRLRASEEQSRATITVSAMMLRHDAYRPSLVSHYSFVQYY